MLWLVIVVVGRGKAWSRVSSGRFILLIGLWGLGVHLSEGRIAVCRLVKFAAPEPVGGRVIFLVVGCPSQRRVFVLGNTLRVFHNSSFFNQMLKFILA